MCCCDRCWGVDFRLCFGHLPPVAAVIGWQLCRMVFENRSRRQWSLPHFLSPDPALRLAMRPSAIVIHTEDVHQFMTIYSIKLLLITNPFIEQTFFCAIDPQYRKDYVRQSNKLLKSKGKLVGLLFDFPIEQGPPFGGSISEYKALFIKLVGEYGLTGDYDAISDVFNTPDDLGISVVAIKSWCADAARVYSRPINPAFYELFERKAKEQFNNK